MARIVGVHGVGQQENPPPGLVDQWRQALHQNLVTPGVGELVAKNDFTVVYYADLYRKTGVRGLGRDYDATDLEGQWEEEFILALGSEAAALLMADDATTRFIRVRRNVQRALNLILKVPGMGRVTESTLIAWFVKEVHRYFNESEVREGAVRRVHDAIRDGDARVVVAHSLGSVVAYEALCQNSFAVNTLITVGSPLGIPKLVFDLLSPAPLNGRGLWPGNVHRWVNIAQKSDLVALRKALAPVFLAGPGGSTITDFPVDDPPGFFQAHNAEHYLERAELAEAVKEAFA